MNNNPLNIAFLNYENREKNNITINIEGTRDKSKNSTINLFSLHLQVQIMEALMKSAQKKLKLIPLRLMQKQKIKLKNLLQKRKILLPIDLLQHMEVHLE